jgi:hypothetical protein
MTEVSLREHIIELISHSGYGVKTSDNVVEIAHSIGVLPETLIEAQARRKERVVDAGVERKIGKRNASYQYYCIAVTFSAQAKEDFVSYCEKRRITPPNMIRSVIHAYLQGSYEPEISGKHFSSYTGRKNNSKPGGTLKTNLTHGAKIALRSRATMHRVSNNNLVRALLQEVMDGKIFRPGNLRVVGRSQMFADASMYYVPRAPGVTKSIRFAGQERP